MARTLPTLLSPIDVYTTDVRPCGYFQQVLTCDSTERHNVEIVSTATFASSESHVGLNIVENTAGTAGAWASGLFVNVVQDSTKRITGYLCAGEFQLTNAASLMSAAACIVLDWANSATDAVGSTQAYIMLSDWGSGTKCRSLFEFKDQTIGANVKTSLISTSTSDITATHAVRFTVANVPYWFIVSSVGPA